MSPQLLWAAEGIAHLDPGKEIYKLLVSRLLFCPDCLGGSPVPQTAVSVVVVVVVVVDSAFVVVLGKRVGLV